MNLIYSIFWNNIELDQDMDGNTGDADLFSVKIKEEKKATNVYMLCIFII